MSSGSALKALGARLNYQSSSKNPLSGDQKVGAVPQTAARLSPRPAGSRRWNSQLSRLRLLDSEVGEGVKGKAPPIGLGHLDAARALRAAWLGCVVDTSSSWRFEYQYDAEASRKCRHVRARVATRYTTSDRARAKRPRQGLSFYKRRVPGTPHALQLRPMPERQHSTYFPLRYLRRAP